MLWESKSTRKDREREREREREKGGGGGGGDGGSEVGPFLTFLTPLKG